ncbi:hypothetical protein [Massilia soli]|uniref:DUF1640 domain-containing protein n=1 Tax=Massilia soli TaxID=2792854 RepID=A0ABS7SP89_9BURK|nr:hypothetical protein [Massilia soli]MBZ2207996.1 hypothetical protein [Massilia soli]
MAEYDCVKYAKRLEDAGVSKDQATVHASALGEVLSNVVFAKQLEEKTSQIRTEMQNMEARLTARIDLLQHRGSRPNRHTAGIAARGNRTGRGFAGRGNHETALDVSDGRRHEPRYCRKDILFLIAFSN